MRFPRPPTMTTSVPGPWAVDTYGLDWYVVHKDTRQCTRIGPVGSKRTNYYDRAIAEAAKRNRALLPPDWEPPRQYFHVPIIVTVLAATAEEAKQRALCMGEHLADTWEPDASRDEPSIAATIGDAKLIGWDTYPDSSVLAGQPRKSFIDTYPDEAAARAAHPDVTGWYSPWASPRVSLAHLPDEDTPAPGGAWPDDYDDADRY